MTALQVCRTSHQVVWGSDCG